MSRVKNQFTLIIWIVLVLISGVLLLNLSSTSNKKAFWDSLLSAFIFITPLATGLPAWGAIVRLSNGRWIGDLERIAFLSIGFAPFSLILLIILWSGAHNWAPWLQPSVQSSPWLSMPWIYMRDIAALIIYWICAIWYMLERKRVLRPIWPSVATVVVYCMLITLLAVDMVMSLWPSWVSALFGMYVFISGLYAGIVLITLLSLYTFRSSPQQRSDLGSLIITFCALTAYLMFCQFLTIWYENMLSETSYIIPRINYQPWRTISWILVYTVYLGPIAVLTFSWFRNNRISLLIICGILLIGLMIERLWLIAPGRDSLSSVIMPTVISMFFVASLFGISTSIMERLLPEEFIVRSETEEQ